MAVYFRGNTATLATSNARDLPMVIESFSLVNKTSGAITANVYMIEAIPGSGMYCIAPNSVSIPANSMYESERQIVMLAGETIRVQVNGSCDYDFYIDNMTPRVANNPTLTGNNTTGV